MFSNSTDLVSTQSLDPVAFLEHSFVLPNLFDRLPSFQDWHSCTLVSKQWMEVNDYRNPRKVLVRAIDGNEYEVVVELLNQGLSPKFRIAGTKLVAVAEDTPYLRAKFRGRDAIASVLKPKDGTFSEEFVKKKLHCLRFDVADCPFSVQGQGFHQLGTEGAGHEFHHELLLSDLISSLKAFLDQRPDTPHWNQAHSKELLAALERSRKLCPSCSPKELQEALEKGNQDELIIFSDTSSFNHTHWVTFAVKNGHYAFGNRGGGCGKYPGVMLRKAQPNLNFQHMQAIRHQHEHCKEKVSWNHSCVPNLSWLYLKGFPQIGPSCSGTSLEAGGILGGIAVILRNEFERKGKPLGAQELKQIHDISLTIFQEWVEFNQDLGLKEIMRDRTIAHDQDLYARFLTSIKTTSQVPVTFFDFLASKGPIPWFGVDKNQKIPCDFVPRAWDYTNDAVVKERNYRNLDSLLLRIVCDAKSKYNPEDSSYWDCQIDLMTNHLMRGFDVQGQTITSYASLWATQDDCDIATNGLLKIAYRMDSKECIVNVILPPKEEGLTLINTCLFLLHERFSNKIKMAHITIPFLPNQESLYFAIQIDSSELQAFIKELSQVYSGFQDPSKMYAQEPRMLDAEKALEKVVWNKEGVNYQSLCYCLQTLIQAFRNST